MKFRTQRLIEVVKAEIAKREADHEATLQLVQKEYDEARAKWLDSEKPDIVREAARAIVRKVGRGQVITLKDTEVLTDRGQSYIFLRSEPENDYRVIRRGKPNVEALQGFLAILESIEDETVTSTALRELGYRNIAPILREATL